MSARIGLLIVGLALSIGVMLLFLQDSGTERGAGASPEERRVDAPTSASELKNADRGSVATLSSETPSTEQRSVVLSTEEQEVGAALTEPKKIDRATVAILSGYVHDEQGRPVADARVLATRTSIELMAADTLSAFSGMNEGFEERFKEASTDESGYFELIGIPPGQPALRVSANGYVPAIKVDLLVAAREHQELSGPIVLDASAIVTGIVLDPNGRPVAGAKVSTKKKKAGIMGMAMAAMSSNGVATAEDGTFRLDMLDPEELEIVVTHASFSVGTADIDAREGGLIEGLEVRLETGSSIRGRVVGLPDGIAGTLQVSANPEDFNPLQGMGPRTSDVADDGSFEIWGLIEGSKWNVFGREKNDDESSMMSMWGGRGGVTDRVEFAAGDSGVELNYRPSMTVIFRVVDAETGRPLTRLKVSKGGMSFGTQPGFDDYPGGKVRLEGQRPGYEREEVVVELDAVGYESRRESIEASSEGEVDLGTLELQPAVVAQFLVIDANTRAPLEGVYVSVSDSKKQSGSFDAPMPDGLGNVAFASSGSEESGKSDADGLARVETSLEGLFFITAKADGYAPFQMSAVELAGSDVSPITLELHQGSVVNVSATDAFGVPLPARKIEHRAPGATGGSQWGADESNLVTDESGVATVEHLEPGEHRFRIAKLETAAEEPNMMSFMMNAMNGADDEDDDSWTTVELGVDDLQSIVLVELPTGRLSGRITEAGKPLKRASLTLRQMGVEDEPADEDMDPSEAMFLAMGQQMSGQGGPSVKSERDGSFAFEGVAVGSYILEVDYKKRAMRTEFEVTIVAGDQVLDFDLDLAILAGQVVDVNGDGVKGALVSVIPFVEPAAQAEGAGPVSAMLAGGLMSDILGIEGKVRTIKTRSSGSFALRGVTPGVRLVVKVDGSEAGFQNHTSEPFEIGRNESRDDLRIVVQLGGAIDVTVVKADGSAAEFVLVRLVRTDGSMEPLNEMAMGGIKQVTGLTPGTYQVIADDEPDEEALFGGGDQSTIGKVNATVEVVSGETVKLELRLP